MNKNSGTMRNLGYLYYREYYEKVDWERNLDESQPLVEGMSIQIISSSQWHPNVNVDIQGSLKFKLTTRPPGLLLGSGVAHEAGIKSEFKLGLYFDHTSGWPYIPGSSVKGVLRNAFRHDDYIRGILNDFLKQTVEEKIQDIEKEIFSGKRGKDDIGMYERDCFLDAHITGALAKVLNDDYITPHKHKDRNKHHLDPFVDPTPIRFLKVEPGVEFTFSFILHDSKVIDGLNKEKKLELFKSILKDLGIGAKTNVGYGGLE